MKRINKEKIFFSTEKRCTLLIPDFMFPLYEDFRDKYGNSKRLLEYLIKKFYQKKTQLFLQNKISATIHYQEKGLELCRIDFRSSEENWLKLKLLANSYNISICAFFVLLLALELVEASDRSDCNAGVPPKPQKIILHQSLICHPLPFYTRIFHIRI